RGRAPGPVRRFRGRRHDRECGRGRTTDTVQGATEFAASVSGFGPRFSGRSTNPAWLASAPLRRSALEPGLDQRAKGRCVRGPHPAGVPGIRGPRRGAGESVRQFLLVFQRSPGNNVRRVNSREFLVAFMREELEKLVAAGKLSKQHLEPLVQLT